MKNEEQEREQFIKDTQEKFCNLIFKENWVKEDRNELQTIFKDIITLGDYWHVPYERITNYIYSMNVVPDRKRIENSITLRLDEIEGTNDLKEATLRHVELAITQKEYIDKNIEAANKTLKKINNEFKEIDNELKKIQDTKSKIYTDFITILGIFTAITFAIFGGLQLIGNCLGNLTGKITLSKIGGILIIASVILLSVYLILIALMIGLSKLLSRNEDKRYKFTGKVTACIIGTIIGLFLIGCLFVFL